MIKHVNVVIMLMNHRPKELRQTKNSVSLPLSSSMTSVLVGHDISLGQTTDYKWKDCPAFLSVYTGHSVHVTCNNSLWNSGPLPA